MAWILQDIRVGTSQIGRVDEDATVKVGTEMPAYSPVLDEYDDFIYLQGVAGTTVGARVVYDDLAFSTILSAVGAGGRVATAMAAVGEGQYGWYRKRFVEPRVQSFYDRDSVVQAFTDGQEFETGTVLKAGATEWIVDNTSTIILDMPGTVPADRYTPQHFGSYGAYKSRTDYVLSGYLLSDRFATLAAAQAVYPDATALTETIDSHAFQRCADAIKAITPEQSSGAWSTFYKDAAARCMWLPRGYYVINRTVDFTNMGSDEAWSLKGDDAVIFNQCVGETGFDMIGTGQCSMDGWTMINDLIRGVGCPRSGMLWGRNSTGAGAAGHKIGRIDIEGFSTLAPIQNYAAESIEYDYLVLRNSLNKNLAVMDYASATATPVAGNSVTWSGGTGTIRHVSSSDSILAIEVLTGTQVTNSQTITYQTSQTATVSSVYSQPSGEGPDGRSYCMVQDGTNYWGTDSQYATNAANDDAASFTINMGRISCLHNGHGDGLWLGGTIVNHWYRGYFTASGDGGSGIVIFAADFSDSPVETLYIYSSIESDDADTDPDTGIAYAVKFEAQSAATDVVIPNLRFETHRPHYGYATFYAGTNVNSVELRNMDYSSSLIGRDSSQVLCSDPSKFKITGSIIRSGATQAAFLNLDSLAECSALVFKRDDVPKFYGRLGLIDDGTANHGRLESYAANGTSTGSYLELSGSDSELAFNGTKVLGIQLAQVADLTINYSAGSPPTPNGTMTIADAASPTNAELLELCLEILDRHETLKARCESHGLIAAS